MKIREKEEVKQSVRDSYGKIARNETSSCWATSSSCCGGKPVALDEVSSDMGYSKDDLDNLPDGADLGLGCGNPVAMATLKEGETVLDLGSGGGIDCFLAAKAVGDTGNVIGVDMTPDMVARARKNAEQMGTGNVEFRLGEIEHLPVGDETVDIVLSNCVINLSPDKADVYREIYRVLKPGGRLTISDILATAPLPDRLSSDLEAVSACIGGAATVEETRAAIREAGFQDVEIEEVNGSREMVDKWIPGIEDKGRVISAYIKAVKPGGGEQGSGNGD